jgi:hypothetical protein
MIPHALVSPLTEEDKPYNGDGKDADKESGSHTNLPDAFSRHSKYLQPRRVG